MNSSEVSIKDLSKVALLHMLWDKQIVAGYFNFMSSIAPKFDFANAEETINKGYIDYYAGRCIKADLSGDIARTASYNRDAGQGAFEDIVHSMHH